MNRSDIARLLTLAAAYDSRTLGDTDVAAWSMALEGLDFDRCRDAIVKHYRENTDRIMPAHVRRLAHTTTGAPGVIPDTGETYCDGCKGVHRAAEPCAVLGRPEGFKQIISTAFRGAADALDTRTPIQRRIAAQSTEASPITETPRRCNICHGAYLEYPAGRDAHVAVFGHNPPSPDDSREES